MALSKDRAIFFCVFKLRIKVKLWSKNEKTCQENSQQALLFQFQIFNLIHRV